MFSFLKPKVPPHPTQADLMAAIKFTDAELKANRDGYMTRGQRKKLRRTQLWQALGMWGVVALLAATAWLIGRPTDYTYVNEMKSMGYVVMGLMLVAMIGLFIWMAFQYQSKTKADLHKGQVASLTGPVYHKTYMVYTSKSAYRVYELHTTGEVFKVSRKVYYAFADGERYNVFYAPHTRMLLSAESAGK